MTNETITLSRELVQLALNAVEYLALRGDDVGASNVPVAEALRAALDDQSDYLKSCEAAHNSLAEPVPPAGGEPDFPEYRDLEAHPVADIEYQRDVGYNQALTDTRPIVTRLQAEVERLKSESFEELYNAAIDERDALQSEVERLKSMSTDPFDRMRDLQSELTKARDRVYELEHAIFHTLDDSCDDTHDTEDPRDVTITRLDFENLCALLPEDWEHRSESNQSAPAECGACPGCADGCQLDRESPPANGVA